MKQRPIGILVDAMRSLGADIEYLSKPDYPPLLIKGRPLKSGHVTMDPGISSQFLSALLMIGCMLPKGIKVTLKGFAVSFPYVEMTLALLNHFGARVARKGNSIVVPHCEMKPVAYSVEPDWTSASFWYEAAALADEADLLLTGLKKDSIQGDAVLAEIFRDFGVVTEFTGKGACLTKTRKKIRGFYYNFSDHPDIALPVMTTCAALGIRGRFEGLKSLKFKETDRLAALRNEMKKLDIDIPAEYLEKPGPVIEFLSPKMKTAPDTRIFTYADHRMAMTFAPLALKTGSIVIENPDVVSKSYPRFWDDIISTGFEIS